MTDRMRGFALAVVVAACGCAVPRDAAMGDLAWTQKRSEIRRGKRHLLEERIFVRKDAMKIETLNSRRSIVLLLDEGVVRVVHAAEGTYRERAFDKLKADRKKQWEHFVAERKGKEKLLDGYRDEKQRARMKAILDKQTRAMELRLGLRDPAVTIEKTGKTKTLIGYPCEEVTITDKETGEVIFDGWVSPKVGHRELLQLFREKLKLFNAGLARMLEKADAFPMAGEIVTKKGAVEVTVEFEVVAVSGDAIPDSVFALPENASRKPWEE